MDKLELTLARSVADEARQDAMDAKRVAYLALGIAVLALIASLVGCAMR